MGKNSKIQNFYKEFCFKCGCFNKKNTYLFIVLSEDIWFLFIYRMIIS